MKKVLFSLAFASVLGCPLVYASNVDFHVGVNIGTPGVAVPVPVPVAPAPQPVYVQPPVAIEEPPEFIAPPELGFYVAVGVPYDLFFAGGRYYLCRGNAWYASPNYNGPWVSARYKTLPWGLRKYPYERIRYFRDTGYRHWREGGNPYWEKHHFHPEKRWGGERRADRRDWNNGRDHRDGGDFRDQGGHRGHHDR
ncbi:MAG TPA: hypothetical protein VFG19_00160 [Geobacteraceae bacterium]|nr:hypothetical protein [Geobacteraceae bacterium]